MASDIPELPDFKDSYPKPYPLTLSHRVAHVAFGVAKRIGLRNALHEFASEVCALDFCEDYSDKENK